jgi:hypothetical protein
MQLLNVFFINKCTVDRPKKTRLKIETVKALTIAKTHFKNFSCAEFYVQISEEKNFLNRSINLINILMNLKNFSNYVCDLQFFFKVQHIIYIYFWFS